MNRFSRHGLIISLTLGGLLATAAVPLTAFEGHVINVTATIQRNVCQSVEIRSMLYWETHPELWILPQTLGPDAVDTTAKAKEVFKVYGKSSRNSVRGQLLVLKFNVAHFQVGPALVPNENITINQLVVQAEALLNQTPAPSNITYSQMWARLARTNSAGHCLICPQ